MPGFVATGVLVFTLPICFWTYSGAASHDVRSRPYASQTEAEACPVHGVDGSRTGASLLAASARLHSSHLGGSVTRPVAQDGEYAEADVFDSSPELRDYVQYLDGLDRRRLERYPLAAPQFEAIKRPSTSLANASNGSVLYVVYSDSLFYATRLKWIQETWAGALPNSSIFVIGDKVPNISMDLRVQPTRCPRHSHWLGACCKYAEALIESALILEREPTFKWVYFTDDDAYVRPDALASILSQQAPGGAAGIVLGTWGCSTPRCKKDGLCAGGGYVASSAAVTTLVGVSTASFLKEQMRQCHICDRWADIALSRIFIARQLEERPLTGLFGWKLSKPRFDATLRRDHGMDPLMYHYIRTESQMKMLHSLFAGPGEKQASPSTDAQTPGTQDLCASFHNHTVCAVSSKAEDHPWQG